jgi:hypothetical protein
MTVAEAHIEFDITVDKRFTSQTPEFPPEVVDYFLREATDRYAKTHYGQNNVYQAGFEQVQKRTDDLNPLVKHATIPTTDVTYETNVVRADLTLAIDYWFFLRARVEVNNSVCGTRIVKPKKVQQDDLNTVQDDPFNKTIYNKPILYFEDGDIFVEHDSTFNALSVRLTYLRRPAQVNVGTYGEPVVEWDMPEHTHREIVQLAANIAIENFESPQRVQTFPGQVQGLE